MLQSVPTSQVQNPALGVRLSEAVLDNPLLRLAGPIPGSHALIIASNGLDLMCSLLQQGCAAATTLRLAERPQHETYDLVLAPRVTSAFQIVSLVYHAKRALVPTGRFLALVPTAACDVAEDIGGMLVRSLRLAGFAPVCTRTVTDGLMVRADFATHGLSRANPRPVIRRQA